MQCIISPRHTHIIEPWCHMSCCFETLIARLPRPSLANAQLKEFMPYRVAIPGKPTWSMLTEITDDEKAWTQTWTLSQLCTKILGLNSYLNCRLAQNFQVWCIPYSNSRWNNWLTSPPFFFLYNSSSRVTKKMECDQHQLQAQAYVLHEKDCFKSCMSYVLSCTSKCRFRKTKHKSDFRKVYFRSHLDLWLQAYYLWCDTWMQ